MKFYRLHMSAGPDGSAGYQFFTSMSAAEKAKRDHVKALKYDNEETDNVDIEPIEIKPTKAGILAALNRYAKHPDNG
jgi:hypothetical protein